MDSSGARLRLTIGTTFLTSVRVSPAPLCSSRWDLGLIVGRRSAKASWPRLFQASSHTTGRGGVPRPAINGPALPSSPRIFVTAPFWRTIRPLSVTLSAKREKKCISCNFAYRTRRFGKPPPVHNSSHDRRKREARDTECGKVAITDSDVAAAHSQGVLPRPRSLGPTTTLNGFARRTLATPTHCIL